MTVIKKIMTIVTLDVKQVKFGVFLCLITELQKRNPIWQSYCT